VRTSRKGLARTRKSRTRKSVTARTPALLAALVAGIAVVLGIIAFATTGAGSAGGRPTSTSQAGGTASATLGGNVTGSRGGKAGGARKPILAQPPQPPMTRGAKWVTGAAGKLLSAVNADMGKISADQRSGNVVAARSDGAKLAADALAALKGPMPPVDAAIYRSSLKDFEQIGNDTANGDFGAASSLLAPANLAIMRVTAAADPPAPVDTVAPASG
jgi:hypothetical protein